MKRGKRLSFAAEAWLTCLAVMISFGTGVPSAWAGSARFVAGQGWGTWAGANVAWNTTQLLYYTDQGPLSATVSHAQADAMVSAAAAVWSVPTSSISFAQGGYLGEDVSPSNVSFDGQQWILPPDVQTANESNIPVAIVYDADGSLIDLLLGADASEPEGCGQNAVIGDVDDIHQDDATIRHATLILNGRCVGTSAQQLTQMQYQLARALGRVLGLSWSQTNDNVFTGQTTVTPQQMAYWPLMHPIDVICGNYTYGCMRDPFTLRVDDLNTLAQLYPVYQGAVPAGKQATSDDALYLWGIIFFPTGQGMDWVNITARRENNGIMEDWETVSAITGNQYQQAINTPVGSAGDPNEGSTNSGSEGYFQFRRVPLDGVSNVFFTTGAINPLYTGDSAVGTYLRSPATPSGPPISIIDWGALTAGDRPVGGYTYADNAAASCATGQDGSETAPAVIDPSGWQAGLLCSWGHSSWWNFPVAAGHSWTLEVTATDETGAATLSKAQPVMGLWNAADPAGVPPTVASQPAPFNSMSFGMTQAAMDAPGADGTYRISITDQFGAGRPDFNYVARVLYAAAVTPAVIGTGGGQIAVTGMGFRQGNQLLVNGVPATVLRWTSTEIIADAPTLDATGTSIGVPVTVAVTDAETGGIATVPNAVSYAVLPDLLQKVSAPNALETGLAAPTPLAVQVVSSDGRTSVSGALVSFAVTGGMAQLGICQGAASCTAATDAQGRVQTSVTGVIAGPVTLLATEISGGATVQIILADADPVRSVSLDQTEHYVAAGASGSWTLHLSALQDGLGTGNAPVTWTVSAGLTAGLVDGLTAANGIAGVTVSASALKAGAVETVTGCAWVSVCATWVIHAVPASEWVVRAPATATQQVAASGTLNSFTVVVMDEAGHPLEGAPVNVYQRVLGWEGPCSGTDRCASAPVLKSGQDSLVSNAAGGIAVLPLQVEGVPQVVEIAVSSGSYGFLTLTLVKSP